jgi:hypothetical protein
MYDHLHLGKGVEDRAVPNASLDLLESRMVAAGTLVRSFGGRIVEVVVEVDGDDFVVLCEQSLAEVGTDESGTAGD